MMVSEQVAAGASLLVASFIAWVGGTGARGMLYGDTGQKIVGLLIGIVSIYLASLLANWGQAMVVLFDIGFPAPLWVLIGAAIGFVFTGRRDVGV